MFGKKDIYKKILFKEFCFKEILVQIFFVMEFCMGKSHYDSCTLLLLLLVC